MLDICQGRLTCHVAGVGVAATPPTRYSEAADNDANIRWVRDYHEALEPHTNKGGYVNFMAGDDQDRIRDNYGPNYDRLASIKKTYDPGNLFNMNQNIVPAT